ncbi:flavin reductase family protein [Porphyromonas endodontalis]|uniref:flavin reductase family protein n=1 Tax=Porphyromonas endodontalis TaxID=28124 RepID=UPI00360BF7CC
MKQHWKPGTMISPVPALLVTSASLDGERTNLFTVSWTGIVCTNPAMCYVSIRPERYSYELIKESMEFGLNLTTLSMAEATDMAGVISGRDGDKWAKTGLHPEQAQLIQCPLVAESPLSMECRVREILPLGSHDMFLAEIVSVSVDESLLNPETGKLDLQKSELLAYAHGEYFGLGSFVGYFGWSVKKGKEPIKQRK